MTTMTKLASFCLLSLVLGVPAVADASGATIYRFIGRRVYAVHSAYGACSYDDIFVLASDLFTQNDGGPPDSSEVAFVSGTGYDCTGTSYSIMGTGPVDLLHIVNNATRASVVATIPVEYCTYDPLHCEETTMSIDLDAEGMTLLVKQNNHNHMKLPDGTHINGFAKVFQREALISGTATLELPDGTTRVFSFESGGISNVSEMSISITPP